MGRPSRLAHDMQLSNDAVAGTYAWLSAQHLSPEVMRRIKVIANHSLRLGMMITISEQQKFKDGLEEELKDDSE